MDEIKIDLNNCCMEVVSEESASIFSGFTSGSPEIDRYFREDAASDPRNVCYAFCNQENGDVIGLAALCCSGINLDDAKLVELIPSIKIDYFAVSEKYQDIELSGSDDPEERYFVSDAFLSFLIKEIRDITESYLGATHIVLYSVPNAVHFYKRNLFCDFEEFMKPEQYRYLDGCKPMYMAL